MRNFIKFKHHINLLKSVPTMRTSKSWTTRSLESNMLYSLRCNNILTKKCYYSNRIDNVKTFSTTAIVLAKTKDRGKDKKKGSQHQFIDHHEFKEVVDVEKLTLKFEKIIDKLKDNFIKNVSLRTVAGAIEELPVTYDGTQYILQQLVQISRTPKMVILNVGAFPQVIPDIISMLTKSQMNLSPQQEGTMIYIPIPKVTKEYRENLSKSAKSYFIKSRDNIKDVRNDYIRKVQNIEKLPKDVCFRVQGYINILTDQYVNKAEKMLEEKQKELKGD